MRVKENFKPITDKNKELNFTINKNKRSHANFVRLIECGPSFRSRY